MIKILEDFPPEQKDKKLLRIKQITQDIEVSRLKTKTNESY